MAGSTRRILRTTLFILFPFLETRSSLIAQSAPILTSLHQLVETVPMSMPDPWKVRQKDPLQEAFDLYSAGRMDQAIQAYQAILSLEPNNAEANHLLGVIAFRQGQAELARDYIARAADSPGATAEMHNNLGSVLTGLPQDG